MESGYINKIGKEDHEDCSPIKSSSKEENLGNPGLIKRFLKWLARGAEQTGRSSACRT